MASSATTRARSTVPLRIMNINPENNHKSSHIHKPSRLGRRCTKRAPYIGSVASTRRGATVIIATLAALCATVGTNGAREKPSNLMAGTMALETNTNIPEAGDGGYGKISISFSGDILVHGAIYKKAKRGTTYNFKENLNKVAAATNADINICHLETVLSRLEPSTYPRFRTPEAMGNALRASGFHGCSLASNHSIDYGYEGIASTIDILRQNGLKYTGTRKNPTDSKVALYTVGGVAVAHLSYTFSTNGIKLKEPWQVNMIDVRTILQDSAAAKNIGDIVVVSLHFGTEYRQTPDFYQTQLVNTLTKSPDIDAIVGHHAHVLQPFARINGKPVFYGLGNLLSAQEQRYAPTGNMGAMVTLHFSVIGETILFSGYGYLPTVVNSGTWRVEYAPYFSPRSLRLLCDSIENSGRMMVGGILDAAAAELADTRC